MMNNVYTHVAIVTRLQGFLWMSSLIRGGTQLWVSHPRSRAPPLHRRCPHRHCCQRQGREGWFIVGVCIFIIVFVHSWDLLRVHSWDLLGVQSWDIVPIDVLEIHSWDLMPFVVAAVIGDGLGYDRNVIVALVVYRIIIIDLLWFYEEALRVVCVV
jgi:hypothetical protein